MSTQTDRYFSRKSSGRSGHGIRLNQTKRMAAPPLNVRVAEADQERERPATWKRDAPAANDHPVIARSALRDEAVWSDERSAARDSSSRRSDSPPTDRKPGSGPTIFRSKPRDPGSV